MTAMPRGQLVFSKPTYAPLTPWPGRSAKGVGLVHRLAGGVCLAVRRWQGLALKLTPTVVVAAVLAGVPVYVDPQTEKLRHADAVLVLGGYEYDRYTYGISLATARWAPNLVISNPLGERDPWLHRYCGKPHPEFTLHCFVPDPGTTLGEARKFKEIAAEYGWRSVIVVTFRPQISRARFILSRCFDGELIMVATATPVPKPRWIYEYLYQTVGFVRAMLQPGC